ncbi:MAG: ribonuclease J [Bacilli bacterium]
MSKINILSLGGLNENGKNLYTISIDDKILVFDVGLKFAPDKMYGVDYIIPNFSYLIENKDKIVGVFISHAHYENMGALPDLLRVLPEIDVYASAFCSKIIELECKEDNVLIKNLHVCSAYKKIEFGEFSVFPFSVTHSVPESFGYAVNTKNGAVVYMADFVIDPTMNGVYDMDLGKLAYIGKQGVLALMCESVFSEKKGHTSPNHKLLPYFKKVINGNDGRIFFSILALHIYTIQTIFDSIKDTDRKVVIMGKHLHNIIMMCIDNNYLDIDKSKIGDLTNLKDKNIIVLVSNDRENPYYNLNRVVGGYDKFITLEDTDTICFADPSYDAYEKTLSKLMDDIAIKGANIESVPHEKSVRLHASSEDIMLMIRLFNPKYYMPIKGEYRYMVGNASLAKNVGIKEENILLRDKGDIVTILDKELVNSNDRVYVDDTLIDGKSTADVGDVVIKDREMLGNNGLVLISATLSKKTKKIKVGPSVVTRGFIYVKENQVLIDEITKRSEEIIKNNTHNEKYADYVKIRTEIREQIGQYLYKETECKPVILTVIQEM